MRHIPVTDASLIEIFSSIQGEGPYIGRRQIFIRFAFCNLSCDYCDTPFDPTANCRIETTPGSEIFRDEPNPVSLAKIERLVSDWTGQPGLHHSISLTGGEPLLHQEILSAWLPILRKKLPIYLETNGTLPEPLRHLLSHIDIISMDIKLPSISGQGEYWQQHRNFLQIAAQKKTFVKVVFDQRTPQSELTQAAQLVASVASDIDLILQPCTTAKGIEMSTQTLLQTHQYVAAIHPNTRVIPQTHNFLGVL